MLSVHMLGRQPRKRWVRLGHAQLLRDRIREMGKHALAWGAPQSVHREHMLGPFKIDALLCPARWHKEHVPRHQLGLKPMVQRSLQSRELFEIGGGGGGSSKGPADCAVGIEWM